MRRLPRFSITAAPANGVVSIEGSELHHLRDVMRIRAGAEILLLDQANVEYRGLIEYFERDHAVVSIKAGPAEVQRPLEVIVAPALIKGPRMDFLVEKAAELGAAELIPLLCERMVMRDAGAQRIERWRRLADAAAKQSLAPRRMAIKPPITVAKLAADMAKETLAIVCAVGAKPLAAIIKEKAPRRLLIACGPEGGFDAAEMELLQKAGFYAAGLGPNRLRSETAMLAALSIAGGAMDELSGSN